MICKQHDIVYCNIMYYTSAGLRLGLGLGFRVAVRFRVRV